MKCKFLKPIYQNKENGYCIFVQFLLRRGLLFFQHNHLLFQGKQYYLQSLFLLELFHEKSEYRQLHILAPCCRVATLYILNPKNALWSLVTLCVTITNAINTIIISKIHNNTLNTVLSIFPNKLFSFALLKEKIASGHKSRTSQIQGIFIFLAI